jgi:uncharacterized protein (DUF427 family)
VEPSGKLIRVEFGGKEIARSSRAVRVLETSHPPVFYVPLDDIEPGLLSRTSSSSFCEFKGRASYYTLAVGGRESIDAAWTYLDPAGGYETLAGMVAFYPGRVDACFVGEELVNPQAGDFYGGWITSNLVGPFKGGPGTTGW